MIKVDLTFTRGREEEKREERNLCLSFKKWQDSAGMSFHLIREKKINGNQNPQHFRKEWMEMRLSTAAALLGALRTLFKTQKRSGSNVVLK